MFRSFATFVLLCSVLTLGAQTQETLTGQWLLIRAEANGNAQEPYILVDFFGNGKVAIMGQTMGTWSRNSQQQVLVIKSPQNKPLDGPGKVVKLTRNEMIVDKDGVRFFYQKMHADEIRKANQAAQLSGLWKITAGSRDAGILRLRLPDVFEFVEKIDDKADTTTGRWMYQSAPQKKALVLVSFSPLRGKLVLKNKTAHRFTFLSKGTLFTAVRIKSINSNQ